MNDHTSSRLSVRGCAVTLRRGGSGRPLLLLHGASDAGLWLPFMSALAARHDVIAPEHPGFGASDMPDWLDTVADLANFHLDLLDALDVRAVDLVGLDLGGWVAAELACRDPRRLATLTLVGAAGLRVKGVEPLDPFLRSDEQRIRDQFHQPQRADELLRLLRQPEFEDILLRNHTTTARLTWQPRGHDPHLPKWLHRVTLPTLLIWGAHDRLTPVPHAHAYQRLIPGSTLAIVPDCGHLPHLEQPQAFVAILEDFLTGKRAAA